MMLLRLALCWMSVVVAADKEEVVFLQASKLAKSEHKPIIWFHLHKYGGTMMCQKARENGENIPHDYDNCQMHPDGPFDRKKKKHVHCDERVAEGYSFSCIERWFTEEDMACADTAIMGIILRDPVDGAKSNILNHHRFSRNETEELFDRIFNSSGSVLEPKGDAGYQWDIAPRISNYMTRSLAAGPGDYMTGEVTEEHLEKAKRNLDKMHVVLILEDLWKHGAQLKNTLHWNINTSKEELLGIKGRRTTDTEEKLEYFSHKLTRKLQLLNQMDYKLLEYARLVADKRTAAAQGDGHWHEHGHGHGHGHA